MGIPSESLGAFTIASATRIGDPGPRESFLPDQASIDLSEADSLRSPSYESARYHPITVTAGAYTAGSERGAVLNAIQVASTPGATADIARAIQTLPGVQNVDEGTGLFVRGGDVSETRVLLNDVVMIAPYNYETPTGNHTVTVNPFLLDGYSFRGWIRELWQLLSVRLTRVPGRPARRRCVRPTRRCVSGTQPRAPQWSWHPHDRDAE